MATVATIHHLIIHQIRIYLRFWIWIIPMFFPGHGLEAQKQYNYYYGKVFEAGTRTGIQGVNLSVAGSHIGTVTDKTGAFSFFLDSVPAMLTVSYVGYESKTILLDHTSYSLTLYLSRSPTVLQEVEIRSSTHEPFFKDNHYSVLDYEIDSSMVYLLVFRQYLSRAQLICKNIYGDTVASSELLYFKPSRLFRDCLGFMHILSHDSGFQVYRQANVMHLIHPVRLKKFDDVLKNCVASTPDILFFQHVTDHGLGVEFYGVDRKTLVKNPVSHVNDEKKLKMLRRNPKDAQLLGSEIQPDNREDFVAWNYIHKILYRPVRTALYRIGDYICVFNTPDRQVEFYDQAGHYSYKLALAVDQVREGRWTNEILVDDVSGKVFTTFVMNGTLSVYEIDLNTGMLRKRLSLFHSYPEKVMVYNEWVYYLYDVSGDPDNKMLFRQKL